MFKMNIVNLCNSKSIAERITDRFQTAITCQKELAQVARNVILSNIVVILIQNSLQLSQIISKLKASMLFVICGKVDMMWCYSKILTQRANYERNCLEMKLIMICLRHGRNNNWSSQCLQNKDSSSILLTNTTRPACIEQIFEYLI